MGSVRFFTQTFFFWVDFVDNIPNSEILTIPETNIAPENGWLEDFLLSYWVPVTFQG